MKTPQRNFVVEFKSGRRQPKAGTTSIWGNTDFKALVREVEDNAPHLFNSNEVPGTPDEGADIPPDRISSGSASEHRSDADAARAAIASVDGAGVEGPKQHEAEFPAAETGAQVHEIQPVSMTRKRPTGTPRKRTERAPAHAVAPIATVTNEDRSVQSMAALDPVSFDDVAALDAENKRLKGLLAEQLRVENFQLKKMLERFDVTECD